MDARIAVGSAGTGSLSISGGHVSTGELVVRNHSTVVVSGGTLSANSFSVGYQGSGTSSLAITGGLVSVSGTLTTGMFASEAGAVTVSGSAGGRGILEAGRIVKGSGTGTINLNGGVLRAAGNQSDFLSGFGTGDVKLNGEGAFVDTAGFAVGISLGLSGSGALTKVGSGTLILTGANSYTGGTTISAGTLQLGNGGTQGSGIGFNDIVDNGVLAFNRSGTYTLNTVISGSGAVKQMGTGLTIFTTNHTYTGVTTIASGTLQLGNSGTGGAVAGNIVNNAALLFNRGSGYIYGGVISGTGAVTKQGGTVVLSGNNTYSNGTTIASGTLQLGAGGTTGSVVGNIKNNGVLVIDRSGTSTYAGVISGTGAFIKQGAGTVILTGNNSYSGSTTIRVGGLQIGNGGTTGAIASSNVVNNGKLTFNRSDAVTYGGVISGTGALTKQGGSLLVLSANNTFTGTTFLERGILQLGTGLASGSVAGNIVNNSALVLNRNDGSVYAGVISGTGSFTKQGNGIITLTGNNTYTKGTTITAGGIQVGNGGVTGAISNANILDNGALVFNRSNGYIYSGVISGTGSVTKLGGTLILSGNNTYTKGTTITSGTLQLGTGGTTGSIVSNVLNNGALVIDRSGALTYGGVISGTGSVTKNGVGSLTLAGSNSFSGGITLADGTLTVGNASALGKGDLTLTAGTLSSTVSQAKVGDDLIWNSNARIALTLRADGSSQFISVGGGLTLTGAGKWIFAFTPVGLPGGHINFKVMTVGDGFGGITAGNFAFVSGDPGLEGTFRISGNDLWFDDGYEPSGPASFDAGSPAAVPEPSTWALLGLGMVVVFVAYRRRIA